MMVTSFCYEVRECENVRHVFSCVDIWLGWHRLVFIPGVVPGEMFNTEQLAALNIDTSILPVV